MRADFLVLLSAVALVSSTVQGQEPFPAEVLQRVKAASVFMKVVCGPLEYGGTGFVVHHEADTSYLVTNAHVVAKPDVDELPFSLRTSPAEMQRFTKQQPVVRVVFNSGTADEQLLDATTIFADAQRDLAIVRVEKVKVPPAPIQLDLNYHPQETTPVYIFGFPFGEALSKNKRNPAITVGTGSISSVRLDDRGEDTVVQIDGAINPGNSGGPIVDVKGRLVGVAVRTIRGAGIGFAIPPSVLDRILSGSLESLKLAQQKTKDVSSISATLKLVDPFHRIEKVALVYCDTNAATTPPEIVEGERIDLQPAHEPNCWEGLIPGEHPEMLLLQAIVTGQQGVERRLPAGLHLLTAVKPQSQAQGRKRPRGAWSLLRPVLEPIVRDVLLKKLDETQSAPLLAALKELSQYLPADDEPQIAAILERNLSHADPEVRQLSARLLATWGTAENGPALMKLLDDAAPTVRSAATETLVILEYGDAAKVLVRQLKSAADRNIARNALIRLGSVAEVPATQLLSDSELAVRITVCEILGEIGTPDISLPALQKIVGAESGLIVNKAKEAMERISSRSHSPAPFRIRLAAPEHRKTHAGLTSRQAAMRLTEGMIVLQSTGPAVAIGTVQTGQEAMELSYVMLVRLPRTNLQKASFATRRKSIKNRERSSHDVLLEDDEFTIEHLYEKDRLPFQNEELTIQGRSFDPQRGRLFLVDVSRSQPVIVQRAIDLPIPSWYAAIDDNATLDLADSTVNELLKVSDEVRRFLDGAPLLPDVAATK